MDWVSWTQYFFQLRSPRDLPPLLYRIELAKWVGGALRRDIRTQDGAGEQALRQVELLMGDRTVKVDIRKATRGRTEASRPRIRGYLGGPVPRSLRAAPEKSLPQELNLTAWSGMICSAFVSVLQATSTIASPWFLDSNARRRSRTSTVSRLLLAPASLCGSQHRLPYYTRQRGLHQVMKRLFEDVECSSGNLRLLSCGPR